MAIIETNWDVQKKDLKLFGTIGMIVFGVLAIGKFAGIATLANYADKFLSWHIMAAIAVLCVIGSTLKAIPQTKRKYGLVGAVLFAAMALAFYSHVFGPNRWVFVCLAAFFALGAFGGSELLRPVYFIALSATFPIGMVVGPIVMGAIFFLVFTPVALIFKMIGRDSLHRRFDPAAPTYWIERNPDVAMKRYFRQF
jgi:hypothetical protein